MTRSPPAKGSGATTASKPAPNVAARPLGPGLYLVATPIGNLRDITLRALDTLQAADVVACEDTRVTAKLLQHYGIDAPMLAYHDHNAAKQRPALIGRLPFVHRALEVR